MQRLQFVLAAIFVSIIAAVVPIQASAQEGDPAQFAKRLAVLNTYLRQASDLAVERARQDSIKSFALRALKHDRAFAADLAESAVLEGIKLEDDLDQEYSTKLKAIRNASDETFDMAYVSAQVTAYESMVELVMSYIENGPIGQLNAFAADHISGPRSMYQIALNLSRTQAPLPAPTAAESRTAPDEPEQ